MGFEPNVGRKSVEEVMEIYALRMAEKDALNVRLIEERDEALTKWHSHQKNVPCAGCLGGHDTFWGTVVSSPQWKAWEESRPDWDIDECRECGHISQGHFQAFLQFAALPRPTGETE